jgi:transposase InsO family protein
MHMVCEYLNREFVDYGYVKVTKWLQRKGFIINRKKVLRLMREQGILLGRPNRPSSGKVWVQELLPQTRRPFEYLEFDIEFMRIDGVGRHAMLLTVLDVLSRANVGPILQWSIRKDDAIALFETVFHSIPLPEHVTVRSDNGSQFEAGLVRDYFKERSVQQEFTRPATPEQNAHVEGYHNVVQRDVSDAVELHNLQQAQQTQQTFDRFRDFANLERIYSGIGFRTSEEVLMMYVIIITTPKQPSTVTINQLQNMTNIVSNF